MAGRAVRWILGVGGVLGVVAATAGWQLREDILRLAPEEHLDLDFIEAVIASESPVFYRDAITPVGVFFEDEHRVRLGYDELPHAYVASIVAAEDGGYWSHGGVDYRAVARAMVQNVTAGRVVSGGSTLTQQTAKNLYYRPDRSLRSKLVEFVNARRLEQRYDKSEILTFYANQFHVTGNGRGLGIAARYFFNKDVDDLTTLESAFLAGLVKAPSYYDPFRGDDARRARAIERAHTRTRYVLGRLLIEEPARLLGPEPQRGDFADEIAWMEARSVWIGRRDAIAGIRTDAQRLLDDGFELQFERGTFRFPSSSVLDEVRRRLDAPAVKAALEAAGIEDPESAGLKVITTLDVDAQRESSWALWHHLTEFGTALEGLDVDSFKLTASKPRYQPERRVHVHDFHTAAVTEVVAEPRKHLLLDLGGVPCTADRDAMVRASVAVAKGKAKSMAEKVQTAAVDSFADAFKPGDVVLASVRNVADGTYYCDLELRPELQGAVVAVEDGKLRAMVGGNDNRNFNRATALRQMGSTWKPVVFHAAIELGWSPTDILDNRTSVFPFSTTWYTPRAAHKAEPFLSMADAAMESENLASVWLFYHLTDRLQSAELSQIAERVDMAPREDEDQEAYEARIRSMGLLPTRSRLDEVSFLKARNSVAQQLGAMGFEEDLAPLLSVYYGWGFGAQRRKAADPSRYDRTWKAVLDDARTCESQWNAAAALWPLVDINSGLVFRAGPNGLEASCTPREGFVSAELHALSAESLVLAPKASLWVGDLRLATIRRVESAFENQRTLRSLVEDADPFSPEYLYWHPDFRIMLGMKYVAEMVRGYGVLGEVQPILSLPLGADEVTLEEMTQVYSGLVSGQAWSLEGDVWQNGWQSAGAVPQSTVLIQEIRTAEDKVIYRARTTPSEVASRETAEMTADLMYNTIEHGTGRSAQGVVRVQDAPLPLGGKTGTTNRFRNAAFIGWLGGFQPMGVRPTWSLGVYVGYDDNRPMRSGRIAGSGARAALPVWRDAAKGIAQVGLLGKPDDEPFDGSWPRDLSPLLAFAEDGEVKILDRRQAETGPLLLPALPSDRPVRVAPSTDNVRELDGEQAPGSVWEPRKRRRRRKNRDNAPQ